MRLAGDLQRQREDGGEIVKLAAVGDGAVVDFQLLVAVGGLAAPELGEDVAFRPAREWFPAFGSAPALAPRASAEEAVEVADGKRPQVCRGRGAYVVVRCRSAVPRAQFRGYTAELGVAPAREGTARAVGGSGGIGARFFQYADEREQLASGRGGRHAVVHYAGRKSCNHGQAWMEGAVLPAR